MRNDMIILSNSKKDTCDMVQNYFVQVRQNL